MALESEQTRKDRVTHSRPCYPRAVSGVQALVKLLQSSSIGGLVPAWFAAEMTFFISRITCEFAGGVIFRLVWLKNHLRCFSQVQTLGSVQFS